MELHIVASDSVLPYYTDHSFAYSGDSGMDLFFPNEIEIGPGETVLVDLEIKCEMKNLGRQLTSLTSNESLYTPKSFLLIPRSSIYKTPLRMANSIGLIDSMYRGNIKVALDNISNESYTVTKGAKLVQIIAPNLEPFKLVITDALSESTRGDKGFGSSGK